MSVIYGIVMLNGQPVNPAMLENMKKALEFFGPDGNGMWIEGNAGLGNFLLYNTPEAVFEKMPFSDPEDNFVFTASARIDNRPELCRIFGISPQQAAKLPDSYFIMRAYQRWGEDCPDHLLGDWSFAAWDKKKQKLFIARDHHGITALYYFKNKDFFVFSSSLKGILCLKEVEKKVNDYKVSQILVGWNEGGPETCYKDIFRLPPAHTLSLEKRQLNTNRYWFLEKTPELRLESEQQYIDLFLDIYTEAVKCRLRSYGPVGATLSGGLDSGSVCALAARELKKEGKRLKAFTSVPLYDITGLVPSNRIGDEGPLAKAVADYCGNIDITFCKAEDISPVGGIEKMLEIHEEPVTAVGNSYWIIDILNKAKKENISTILTGQGGNYTVSWPYPFFNKIFLNKSKIFKSYIFRFLRYLVFHFLNGIILKKIFNIKNVNRRIRIFNQVRHYLSLSYYSLKDAQNNLLQLFKSKTGALMFENGINYNLEFRDPTNDKHLITFSLSYDFSKNNCSRYFVKKAFHKILPNEILYNTKLGFQSADLIHRCEKSDNYNISFQTKNLSIISYKLRPLIVNKFLKRMNHEEKMGKA